MKKNFDDWNLLEPPIHREKGHRCTICNCVNIADIETDLGDYMDGMSFVQDPSSSDHFICIECHEAIQDHRDFFAWRDEVEDEAET